MAVEVVFLRGGNISGRAVDAIMSVRKREPLALDATTTITAEDGELIMIGNRETDMVRIAVGTTPDADATTASASTSAGFPVPAGQLSPPIVATAGMKVNVKAAD